MILPFPKESPNASTGTTSRGAQGHPMPQVVVRLLLGHGNGTAWDAFFLSLSYKRNTTKATRKSWAKGRTKYDAKQRLWIATTSRENIVECVASLLIRPLMTKVGPSPLMNAHIIHSGFRHMISAPGNNLTSQKKSAEFHDIVKQKASQSDPKIDKKKDDPLTANQI